MKYQALLFDLDGTLTASGEGIIKSVQYALRKMGMEEQAEDLQMLRAFIGPPLLQSYMKYCRMTEEQAKQAVVYYRERYNVTGLYENRPYDGIRTLLEKASEKDTGWQWLLPNRRSWSKRFWSILSLPDIFR